MKRNYFHFLSLLTSLYIMVSLPGCNSNPREIADYPIRPVPFTSVRLTDNFWAPRILINHEVTIPLAFRKSEETGRIDNFKVAGRIMEGNFCSLYPFDDSDVFKNIEAASYSMLLFPDPGLDAYLDTLISYIAAAQEADGYLYTNRTIDPANTHEMAGPERWVNLEGGSHELYNAGHLYEAAVAHFQATGKRALLDVAIKNANLIDSLFGWGKIEKVPGHQEIEIGLVRLYRITGERKYLELAKFFLDRRGPGGSEYSQMHLRPVDQDKAVGHAVRAQYMYAAMADIAALTGDKDYLQAIDRLWGDVVSSKTYLTGGIGAVGDHEGFGEPYFLPNEDAYCETCAAIANAFWNFRMFLLHGDSKYFDVFEKVLYNGLLSGVSLTGDHFFYSNPLASSGQHQRKPWFGCACCPVNITRFLPSLPGYIYATNDRDLYINLFMSNEASVNIRDHVIRIIQQTDYPWSGKVNIRIETETPMKFNLMVRVPGWAINQAFVSDLYAFDDTLTGHPHFLVNNKEQEIILLNGYASIQREWHNGDMLFIDLPLIPRKVIANPQVKADSGLAAVQYGPVIYCLEQTNLASGSINDIYLNSGTSLENQLVPYFSWANRGPGAMKVWIPVQ